VLLEGDPPLRVVSLPDPVVHQQMLTPSLGAVGMGGCRVR
jgi:hypothetical protein